MAVPEIDVAEMITSAGKKIHSPNNIRVAIGDTVRFVNVRGKHNTESMRGMIPAGAARWNSQLEQQCELKITHERVNAYRCTPNYRRAMVEPIVAGNSLVNLRRARQAYTNPMVADVFDELFAQAVEDKSIAE